MIATIMTVMFEGFTRTEISHQRRPHRHRPRRQRTAGAADARQSLHPCVVAQIAPRLASEFTVVCTDLRGYGDSEKPPGGDKHVNYSFRAMAQDQVEVMAALGFDRFYAAGHDRGARVLHRMCLDHPQKVARAAIIDIIPQHYLSTT